MSRALSGGGSKGGGRGPLIGRLRDGDFQGEGEIRNPLPLEWRFWALLPPRAKVSRVCGREILPIDNIQHMCYDDQYKASALGKGIT